MGFIQTIIDISDTFSPTLMPYIINQSINVSPHQSSDEKSLLANEFGSPRYTEFIQGLGDLISIEQAEKDKIYLGGLTPSDGKFTVTWNDESLRGLYHFYFVT